MCNLQNRVFPCGKKITWISFFFLRVEKLFFVYYIFYFDFKIYFKYLFKFISKEKNKINKNKCKLSDLINRKATKHCFAILLFRNTFFLRFMA